MIHLKRGILAGVVAAMMIAAAPLTSAQDSQDPYDKPDESWISLSGTVRTVAADTFSLDYGDGIITVELDDWDNDADAYKLRPGDQVVVSGRIDDDFFASTSIEARSVYVKNIQTYFFASAEDEEDAFLMVREPGEVADTVIVGTVTEVDGEEFTVDTALREITVDTSEMLYDPLDAAGIQRVTVGDRVRVRGELEARFFEGRELVADSVITLFNGS